MNTIAGVLLLLAAAAGEGENVYRIAPGDVLSVIVAGRADLSFHARVLTEGEIVLPGCSPLKAAGLRVVELSRLVQEKLETEAHVARARVAVSLVSYGPRKAFIYGEVRYSKALDLPAEIPMTASQAMASAGGFLSGADRHRVRLMRRTPQGKMKITELDLQKVAEGDLEAPDPILQPGDTVYVPLREPVYVLGQVANSGAHSIPYGFPFTVSKAVSLAGGFTKYARYTRVRVIRREKGETRTFTVDLGAVLSGESPEQDIELKPGDTVFMPERIF